MYADVIPSLVENTTTQKRIDVETGKTLSYWIRPDEGYLIHTKEYDEPVYDEETMEETGEIRLGFTRGLVTVGHNYDFETNQREIYTISKNEIPEGSVIV